LTVKTILAPQVSKRWSRAADALIALVLFVSAFAVGDAYFRAFSATGAKASFGQGILGASVGMACGRGFVNPGYLLSPQFTDFLAERRDDVTCSEFPAVTVDRLTFTPTPPPSPVRFTSAASSSSSMASAPVRFRSTASRRPTPSCSRQAPTGAVR